MEADDLLEPDLDEVERRVLRAGVVEWGGPAHCTEEMAVAMGFASVRDLFDSADRLISAISGARALSALDWLRVLLATEIVFARSTMGSGREWSITTGLSDSESLAALRSIQRKFIGLGGLIGTALGTRPDLR